MLKINSIQFTDSKGNKYSIDKSKIESFPLIGGEAANMVTTQVWNQHGSTPINAFMEPYEGELVFIIKTTDLSAAQIAEKRRELVNICNPLNGTVTMTIFLNNGEVYNRDITFVSAPNFPIGFENRNRDWQKVQLLYTANNPFWYSEEEIFESFQGVDPILEMPFEMSPTAPIIFGNVIPSKVAVNQGQAEAPVIIEITGAAVNPRITNETTGEFISFRDLTMTAGQKLVIDTTFGRKKVELDGVNVFNKLDFSSTFFNLVIGENAIDFSDETGNNEAEIYFRYKNLYITI
jgi:hypothetical protein